MTVKNIQHILKRKMESAGGVVTSSWLLWDVVPVSAAKPTEGQSQDEHHVFLSCRLMTEEEMFTFSMPYIIKSLRASG